MLARRTPLLPKRIDRNLARKPMRRAPRKRIPAAAQRYWDSLPSRCEGCGHWDQEGGNTVIHHILANAPGKQGRRDHMLVVRLCPLCHNMGPRSVHLLGSEAAYQAEWGVDLVAVAVRYRDAWEARQ